MYSRLERRPRLSLYDDSDGDDLFCNCASCGCSACLSAEEVGDAGRMPQPKPAGATARGVDGMA
jgi:hypothetical protein